MLIHYTGDIHQPLHATSRVDHEYKRGDRGGNSVYLPKEDGVSNLHAVWDSVIYEWVNYANMPFNEADWNQLGDDAARLVKDHPIQDSDKVDDLDPIHWALESLAISEADVYPTVEKRHAVSEEYKEKNRKIAEK